MNPLLSALLVTLSMSTAGAVQRAAWSPLAAAPHADPFAGVPHDLALWRGGSRSLTVAPTGAGGPSFPLAFDASSAAARRDRLKAERMADLHAMGGGVVLTLTSF